MKKRNKNTAAYRYEGRLLSSVISGIIMVILVILGLYQLFQIIKFFIG